MDQPALEAQQPLDRFDPRQGAGKLINSEHRGRYWWAAQVAEGKDVFDAGCGFGYGAEILAGAGAVTVTGVDIDEATIATAREHFPALADSFRRADLCRLEVPTDSFDLVVCFETIQQVADPERALGELHRVLRPEGLLLISSPSPDVYSGNERHVHEYRSSELAAVLEERFANVTAYRQHPWLASSIEPLQGSPDLACRRAVRATAELEEGAETYSILAASDAELPEFGYLLTLGKDFEVRWWAEQVETARREAGGANGAGPERVAELERELHRAGERLVDAEADARRHAEAVARIADQRAAEAERAAGTEADLRRGLAEAEARREAVEESLRKTSGALLDANQALARLPAMQHRYEEFEALRVHVEILEGSRSWRYLAPARWLRRKLSFKRR